MSIKSNTSDGVAVVWLRRDLRLEDNRALHAAVKSGLAILPVFIFDKAITASLEKDDARITFIHNALTYINNKLKPYGGACAVYNGSVEKCMERILAENPVTHLFYNKDYEPYGVSRDKSIDLLMQEKGITVQTFCDHLIMEPGTILKKDGLPYTIYTPFMKKWRAQFALLKKKEYAPCKIKIKECQWATARSPLKKVSEYGFIPSTIKVKEFDFSQLSEYHSLRDIPSADGTSKLGPHLRFGTIGIRTVLAKTATLDSQFLNELIWREFFITILYHFPHVLTENFKPKYNGVAWRNNESEFSAWCRGETGYPLVDAGMRELNETGTMHNRVRMITAGFLCKHLLIDWRWGERYFASKLLDYEAASNNGNWQWSAGVGCDSAPYFRIFNPQTQQKKFDPELLYVRKWISEYGTVAYPVPIVEHSFARLRALETYKSALYDD